MAWSAKQEADLTKDLDSFLGDLCVGWGFCNSLTAEDLIAIGMPIEATEFAEQVLRAEGMNPEYEVKWVRRIRNRFIERYGSSAVTPADFSTDADRG